ncbi:hypothetical protein [Helicobacter sp. 23-1045]
MSGVKLKIKIILKAIFHAVLGKTRLKAKILRFFSRDYELDSAELEMLFKMPLKNDTPKGDFIASLTTFPARIGILKYALHSIFSQNLAAKKVILVLSKAEFDEANAKIPQEVLEFQKYGLEIMWVAQNLRQYNKIIPILRAFPNENIITIDDDIYYDKKTFETLWRAHLSDKSAIWAHKSRIVPFSATKIDDFFEWKIIRKRNKKWQNRPRFDIFLEGCGGVFYPPNSLHCDVCDEKKFMNLAPKADDIWLWAMAVIKGTKIACVSPPLMGDGAAFTNSANNPALWQHNMNGGNDRQMRGVLAEYPQILRILQDCAR